MLKKIYRLIKKKDFDNVFKTGKSSYDKIIGVKIRSNKSTKMRFGIIVSNKISKKAVERNKIKRIIREIIRRRLNKINSGGDCVIITRPDVLKKDYQEIEQSINKHFKRLKIK